MLHLLALALPAPVRITPIRQAANETVRNVRITVTVEADVECEGLELRKMLTHEGHYQRYNMPVIAGLVPYDDKNTMVSGKLAAEGPEVGKAILSAPYLTGGRMGTLDKQVTVCTKYGWSTDRRYVPLKELDALPQNQLFGVQGVSLGCTLIPRAVLEKVEFRYVHESSDFSDIWFSVDVRRTFGEQLLLLPEVRPKHHWRSKEWKEVGKR